MGVGTLVSLTEYLSTSYDPDVEYVDGALVERHVGDWLHSLVQSNIIFALRTRYPHLKVAPELRSQTTATRFRLPDVTVLRTAPQERYLVDAALIVVEILSEEDRMTRVMEKLAEYEALGVPNIWVIDPRLQQIAVFEEGALRRVEGEVVRTVCGEVELRRGEVSQE